MDRTLHIFGVPFTIFADAELGMAFNAIGLEPTDEDAEYTEAWSYRPEKGEHEPLYKLTIGLGYLWRLK